MMQLIDEQTNSVCISKGLNRTDQSSQRRQNFIVKFFCDSTFLILDSFEFDIKSDRTRMLRPLRTTVLDKRIECGIFVQRLPTRRRRLARTITPATAVFHKVNDPSRSNL